MPSSELVIDSPQQTPPAARRFWQTAYALDLRSLALFRVGLGIVIIGDLLARAQATDLRAFYTDDGVLPRALLLKQFFPRGTWSIHLLTGSTLGIVAFFIVAGVVAFSLLVGYHTRLCTVASWFFLVSLQARNPLILHGADGLLRLLLFWAMFLPLGECWSLDRRRKGVPLYKTVFSAAAIGVAAQVVMLYLFAFLLKSGAEWRQGRAVAITLTIEQLATPLGRYFLQFPHFLRVLTYGVLGVELIIPILVFFPIRTAKARMFTVVLIMVVQLGFGLALRLGHFPYVACVAAMPLIPSFLWDSRSWARKDVSTGVLHARVTPNVLAGFFVIYMLIWNLGTVSPRLTMSPMLQKVATVTRVDQTWDMFAPSPLTDDGWYVIPGRLANGAEVDLLSTSAGGLGWEKPLAIRIYHQYPSERWAEFLLDLEADESGAYRLSYAKYLCLGWNERKDLHSPDRLQSLKIYFMRRADLADQSPHQRVEKRDLFTYACEK